MAKNESNEDLPPFTPTSTSVGIEEEEDSSFIFSEHLNDSFYRDDGEREPLLQEVDDAENYKKTTHSLSGSEGWRSPYSTSGSVARLKRLPPHQQ